MSRYYSGNPYHDYDMWEEEQEARLNKLPVCCSCNEHIQDEYAYRIGGELYCRECIDDLRVNIFDLCDAEYEV